MDIILTTTFSNPRLPVVQVPGFFDDFSRVAGDGLGSTSREGRPWTVLPSAGVWQINADETASIRIASGGNNVAVVDALGADGILRAVVADAGTSSRRGGVVFRCRDLENYLAFHANSAGFLALYRRSANSSVALVTTEHTLQTGDVITVALAGPSVSCTVNGSQLAAADVPEFASETRHGLFGHSTAYDMKWDEISFAAP